MVLENFKQPLRIGIVQRTVTCGIKLHKLPQGLQKTLRDRFEETNKITEMLLQGNWKKVDA